MIDMKTILDKIKNAIRKEYISYRFRETVVDECHCCCILLETDYNTPLSEQFVMDVHGHFYCAECSTQFEDEDERIYMGDQ